MLLHWVATLVITVAVLASVATAAIAWRMSQGPIEMPWLTARLEQAANAGAGPTHVHIGSVALAWEGFRRGVDRPLDLRLRDVLVTDASGATRMAVAGAEVSLSLYELVLGRIALRAVTVDAPRLTFIRAEDGTLSLDFGGLAEATDTGESPIPSAQTAPLAGILAELAKPPASDRNRGSSLFAQLRMMRVRDARITVVDRKLGVTWQAPRADIDITRRPGGGADGNAAVTLALGQQQARLTLSATMTPGATETEVRARFTQIVPGELATAAPSLAALAALDAPVQGEIAFDLGSSLSWQQAQLRLQVGGGSVRIGAGSVPFQDAVLVASATPGTITVDTLRLTLRGHSYGQDTHLRARGIVRRESGVLNADVSANLDQVDFADLSEFWPADVAHDARDWLIANVQAGTARDGHVDLGLVIAPDLSSVQLTRASGTLDGDDLQVHWLRPIPPIDNGRAQLRIVDPDTLDIVVTAGQQELGGKTATSSGELQLRSGRMRITGIMQPHQVGTIDAEIVGGIADAIALLREPRLALLDRHPIDLKDPSGTASVRLNLTVPLEAKVTMDQIPIHAQAHLRDVHLSGIAAGRNVDRGTFDLDADGDGMKLSGRALLAAIPVTIDANLDFRAGSPTQIVQRVAVAGQADANQLAAAGLDATPILSGMAQIRATLTERRNGSGDLAVAADLTSAALTVAPLEWRKDADVPATAAARLVLDHDRLARVDNVKLDGTGFSVSGRGTFSNGALAFIALDRVALGRTSVSGTIRLPATRANPIVVSVSGAALDLEQRFARKAPVRKPTTVKEEPPPGPPWILDATFDRVLMAHGSALSRVSMHADNDGRVLRQLRIAGETGPHAPFLVQIVPASGKRRITASAADTGELLRSLDYVRTIQGGKLSLEGEYDDGEPGRPLVGTAQIAEFRVRDAPVLGKLLQAMTLYGLVEVLQGPGLGFSKLVMPFRLTDDALDITDARAFSQSLGLTAKGRFDLDAQRLDLQGTIVPAYFFNSLLGNVPLVGKLFSPERGGGVFAASYSVHGPTDSPSVVVNPLTALTPGFLRGLFRLF